MATAKKLHISTASFSMNSTDCLSEYDGASSVLCQVLFRSSLRCTKCLIFAGHSCSDLVLPTAFIQGLCLLTAEVTWFQSMLGSDQAFTGIFFHSMLSDCFERVTQCLPESVGVFVLFRFVSSAVMGGSFEQSC